MPICHNLTRHGAKAKAWSCHLRVVPRSRWGVCIVTSAIVVLDAVAGAVASIAADGDTSHGVAVADDLKLK